jgi:translation initiation factor 2B subunit (eIF-2B alpha/beta/delta family)
VPGSRCDDVLIVTSACLASSREERWDTVVVEVGDTSPEACGPHSCQNRDVTTEDDVLCLFQTAANDREHGASEIEKRLVRGLLALGRLERPGSLRAGADALVAGQPAMANLRSLAEAAAESDAQVFAKWLEDRSRAMDRLPERLAAATWPLLEGKRKIVTISRSTAVAAVVEAAWGGGWRGSVVVLDGTSTGRGPEQARRLSVSGEARSAPDATAPEVLGGPGTVVLVGADAVAREHFVNAMGTTMLLELAGARDVDRVLVADSGKNVSQGVLDEIVAALPHHREEPDREWAVFEAVPLELISTRITESGILDEEFGILTPP